MMRGFLSLYECFVLTDDVPFRVMNQCNIVFNLRWPIECFQSSSVSTVCCVKTTRMPKIPNKNEAHIQIIIAAEEDNLLLMALSTNIAE
jgi:hypothetical protein